MNDLGRLGWLGRIGRIGRPGRIMCAAWIIAAASLPARASGKPSSPGLPSGAADLSSLPEPLRAWVPWALHNKEDALCPILDGASAKDPQVRCAWPSRLALSLDETSGRFSQSWRTYKVVRVPLPGDDKHWPGAVLVDGKPAAVVADGDAPSVRLAPGEHTVTGVFAWDALPESLKVPPETGLLSLSRNGVAMPLPVRDTDGTVWLAKGETSEEADVLEIEAHRRIDDEIPMQVTTRLSLRVAGKSREVLLGSALLDGFVPMSVDSVLPARLEPSGRLRLQVRPGSYTVEVKARHEGPVVALTRPAPDGPWADGAEVWVLDARPDLRQVSVENVAAIDPGQTTLPDAWKRLPAYPMKPGDTLKLVEQRRGDSDAPADRLSLSRELWLDFDGGGYSVNDRISGALGRSTRLSMGPGMELGRVAVSGLDQLITRGGTGQQVGVELRQGELALEADSRARSDGGRVPAVGWDADFHHVEATLNLPPGWILVHASGADEVPDTWLRRWSLLDLFLALLVTLAVGRLFGALRGGLALVTMALTLTEPDAPHFVWLAVLAFEALHRALPAGRVRELVSTLRLVTQVAVVVLALPFAVQQVRQGLYPSLAHDLSLTYPGPGSSAATFGVAQAQQAEVASPTPPAAPAGARDDVMAGMFGGGGAIGSASLAPRQEPAGKKLHTSSKAPKRGSSSSLSPIQQYDQSAPVQTGPGLPAWRWERVDIHFSGPVERGQTLRLWLVPPLMSLVLCLLRVELLVLLLLVVARFGQRPFVARLLRGGPRGAAVASLLLLPLLCSEARADTPSPEILDQLQTRLLERPECMPHCASIARLLLDVEPRQLRGRMEVAAAAATAVALPGGAGQWSPSQVLLDGKPAVALLRTSDGKLWLGLPEGLHQVLFEGPLPPHDAVHLPLPEKPHRVEVQADGFTVAGLHEDGLCDDDLQLTRTQTKGAASVEEGLAPAPLPAFVRVERDISLGLTWQVDTRVQRLTPTGTAVALEVPLLPGESVTSADVHVVDGKAQINLGPEVTEASWRSLLSVSTELRLSAPRALPVTEVWRVDSSPVWHLAATGIPPVHPAAGAAQGPEWRPWPGEEVRIAVTRPAGADGRTLTVDHSLVELKPGLRSTEATITFRVRSSRGGQHPLTLPAGATLDALSVGGHALPVGGPSAAPGPLLLPILPGAQEVRMALHLPVGIGTHYRAPAIDLGVPSVNAEVQIETGDDRFVLLVGGPRLGPAVLVWGLLLVLILVGAVLGRVPATPLRARHWILLGLGLLPVDPAAALLVAAWLLALGYRGPGEGLSRRRYNLRQLVLVALTVAALLALASAIHDGLLGLPEMQIRGNGSSASSLRWFQDRVAGELPRPWVVSLPMLAYRVAMLLWALWMAAALVRWLTWGWSRLGEGGLWRRDPAADEKPPRPTPPSPPSATPPPVPPTTPKPDEGAAGPPPEARK